MRMVTQARCIATACDVLCLYNPLGIFLKECIHWQSSSITQRVIEKNTNYVFCAFLKISSTYFFQRKTRCQELFVVLIKYPRCLIEIQAYCLVLPITNTPAFIRGLCSMPGNDQVFMRKLASTTLAPECRN